MSLLIPLLNAVVFGATTCADFKNESSLMQYVIQLPSGCIDRYTCPEKFCPISGLGDGTKLFWASIQEDMMLRKGYGKKRVWMVMTILIMVLAACATATAPEAVPSTSAEVEPTAAAEPEGDAAQPQGEESLVRIRTTASVGTHFNPLWFIGTGSQWHTFPFIWYPLVYNAESQMEPWLAESIEVSEDAKTWTFHLHPDAVWSDGEPVTAADVKWSWELLMNPKTAEIESIGIYMRYYIEGTDALMSGESDEIFGIVVVDDKTVRFNLAEANPLFLYDAYVFVMPKHVLGDVPLLELPDHPYVDNPTVTFGPYRLVQYEPRNFIEIEVSDTWWGEQQPNIDRVVLIQPSSRETALNMLEAGEMDMSPYLNIDEVERLEERPVCVPSCS